MTSVLVFGSINMDVVVTCARHPRLGETVVGTSVAFHPGGKGANQGIAAARCAGKSFLIGSIGADEFGKQMLAHLQENDVDTSGVAIESGGSTGVAIITVDAAGENAIVVTPGANALAKAPAHLPDTLSGPVIALAQLESPIAEIAPLFARVRATGGTTILNPSPYRSLPRDLLQITSVMILNEHEFTQLTGSVSTDQPQDIIAALESYESPLPCCIITLGPAGFVLAERDRAPIHIGGHEVAALDTTGAGDCFAGWFAAELAHGRPVEEAAHRANAAAAISVTRAGAGSSIPTRSEVENFLGR
ncbi:MAG: ribokinase [Methylobacteriaceae bacterium]|jgi:ribokinase|nr:ribokinase [Methylobacteriaceae bacterium]